MCLKNRFDGISLASKINNSANFVNEVIMFSLDN